MDANRRVNLRKNDAPDDHDPRLDRITDSLAVMAAVDPDPDVAAAAADLLAFITEADRDGGTR